jgi:hypothetical protein
MARENSGGGYDRIVGSNPTLTAHFLGLVRRKPDYLRASCHENTLRASRIWRRCLPSSNERGRHATGLRIIKADGQRLRGLEQGSVGTNDCPPGSIKYGFVGCQK